MSVFPDTPNDAFKTYVYEQLSRVAKALSSPHRLVILNILCQGEHTVEALARYAELSLANVSQHLQLLKSVNLVRQRREGKFVFYSMADDSAARFFTAYRDFTYQRLSELHSAMNAVSGSPSRHSVVTIAELAERMESENLFLLDVRPREEYLQNHLPGAVSIPLDELEQRIGELPSDRAIVTYCRGVFCILADKAIQILDRAGLEARRLDAGLLEWRQTGLPTDSG